MGGWSMAALGVRLMGEMGDGRMGDGGETARDGNTWKWGDVGRAYVGCRNIMDAFHETMKQWPVGIRSTALLRCELR